MSTAETFARADAACQAALRDWRTAQAALREATVVEDAARWLLDAAASVAEEAEAALARDEVST